MDIISKIVKLKIDKHGLKWIWKNEKKDFIKFLNKLTCEQCEEV